MYGGDGGGVLGTTSILLCAYCVSYKSGAEVVLLALVMLVY